MRSALLIAPLALAFPASSQEIPEDVRARIAERCQESLAAVHERGSFEGGSAALILPDGTELALLVGAPTEDSEHALRPEDRMLAGSIGKTYFSAAALHLVEAGKLSLDEKVAPHFEDPDGSGWFARMPNAKDLTIRHLMRHQSGIPRYIMASGFSEVLLAEPDKVWKPEECLAYVFDAEPLFAPGDGWFYSDTNYIVLGMVLEKVTGERVYDYVAEHLLEPHGLEDTVPSDRREIPGLIQGRSVLFRGLGFPERVLEDGRFVVNPQFEWCGGGYATTPLDLARWARILYSGKAFEGKYLARMLDGAVLAEWLGPGTKYGLGVKIRETRLGTLLGHDGVFPGYGSTMGYFADHGIAAAFQVNTDDGRAAGKPLYEVLVDLAAIAAEELPD